MNTEKLFEAALGLTKPWYVSEVEFDAKAKTLTIKVDFPKGSQFQHPEVEGVHPVYDTEPKRLRHLNFFEHECFLEVRFPRVKLPNGLVQQATPPEWFGKLDGFTLLFEALVMTFCRSMTFAAASRLLGISEYHVKVICERYVNEAVENLDLSKVRKVAIDETSRAKGHSYVTIAADADRRGAIFVAEGRDSETIKEFAADMTAHKGDPNTIESVAIDMSPAFIKGVSENLPNARITFDKFHVIAHASQAVDKTRREEQRTDPTLKGMRWKLLKDRGSLNCQDRTELDILISKVSIKRTARAWVYREQLREILDRKQINVLSAALHQWCTNVMRSKVGPMKEVARMVRNHFDGVIAWAQTRQTTGFMEAMNGLFQAAKRNARGYTRFSTIRTVIFLRLGKLDLSQINHHLSDGLPTRI